MEGGILNNNMRIITVNVEKYLFVGLFLKHSLCAWLGKQTDGPCLHVQHLYVQDPMFCVGHLIQKS